MAKAEIWNCTNEQYHADTMKIGNSMLNDFYRSPRRFEGLYLTKTIEKPAATAAMAFGSAFHCAVLEPARYATQYVYEPVVNKRTNDGKAALERFYAKCQRESLTPIDAEDGELIATMVRAIRANATAWGLLDDHGHTEQAIHWTDDLTGLQLKSRRDKVHSSGELLLDLKSTDDASPQEFAKSCANFRYYAQADFYCRGHKALTGTWPTFIFIAASKKPPYEVACYELDQAAMQLGAEQNTVAMSDLAMRFRTNDWRPAHETRINLLGLPKYTFFNDEWRSQ